MSDTKRMQCLTPCRFRKFLMSDTMFSFGIIKHAFSCCSCDWVPFNQVHGRCGRKDPRKRGEHATAAWAWRILVVSRTACSTNFQGKSCLAGERRKPSARVWGQKLGQVRKHYINKHNVWRREVAKLQRVFCIMHASRRLRSNSSHFNVKRLFLCSGKWCSRIVGSEANNSNNFWKWRA